MCPRAGWPDGEKALWEPLPGPPLRPGSDWCALERVPQDNDAEWLKSICRGVFAQRIKLTPVAGLTSRKPSPKNSAPTSEVRAKSVQYDPQGVSDHLYLIRPVFLWAPNCGLAKPSDGRPKKKPRTGGDPGLRVPLRGNLRRGGKPVTSMHYHRTMTFPLQICAPQCGCLATPQCFLS